MSPDRRLRPIPRRLVACAAATAVVAALLAHAGRTRPPVADLGADARSDASLATPAPAAGVLLADVPAAGRLTATLYDRAGARVRVLVDDRPARRGRTRLAWDGRDEAGHAVPTGAYALKLEVTGGHTRALRVTRVRWPARIPGA